MYDYLIVDYDLYGAFFSHEPKKAGCNVLVIDKSSYVSGNVYTKLIESISDGVEVHLEAWS